MVRLLETRPLPRMLWLPCLRRNRPQRPGYIGHTHSSCILKADGSARAPPIR